MSILTHLFCCLTIYNVSLGRMMQGIIGRNVSLQWTFNNRRNDATIVLHDDSFFLKVWPDNNYYDLREQPDRVRFTIDKTANGTVTLTIHFLNITKNDAGMYKVKQQWSSEELNDSVLLETVDEKMIPEIAIASYNILDSSLVLECKLSNTSNWKFSWRLNGSHIESHSRHSQNDTFLSIQHLTLDDQYSLYSCKEPERGLESDPYNIKIYGPNTITFAPNTTIATEHFVLSVSCLADCYPLCTWEWSKLDPTSGLRKIISAEKELHIQNSTRQDTGTYSCRVQNKLNGVSLENFTSLEIVYGPSAILFNSSDKIIQVVENDAITISCSADCFPPCQIGWTETHAGNLLHTAELKLANVKRDANFTCHAMNPRKNFTTISDTVYVLVKTGTWQTSGRPGVPEWKTNVMNSKSEISYYMTTSLSRKEYTEDLPPKRYFLYIVVGIVAPFAAAFLACLLHKRRICTSWTDANRDGGNENLRDEILPGYYWTIISNERGELCTATETSFDQSGEPSLTGQNIVPKNNESEQSISSDVVKTNEEGDGYINPIQPRSVAFDEYIHPFHSDTANTMSTSIHFTQIL